jgi:hypothetical protein
MRIRRKDACHRRRPCTGLTALWCTLRGAGRSSARGFKEMSRAPKSCSTRIAETNVGSPKGREP